MCVCLFVFVFVVIIMVRVGAKRERPCMVVFHVALRAAALPSADKETASQQRADSGAVSAVPKRYIWKSRRTADVYASAVLSRVRAWWETLGGVRYGLPDAVRLASAVWDGEAEGDRGITTAAPAAAAKHPQKQSDSERRGRRVSATQRRSGVLRCVVQLSRSLYGDAAALHIFRAACACVTEVHVSLPILLTRSVDAFMETAAESSDEDLKRRRQRIEEGGPRMEQDCHAAVRVVRVEHVVSSRKY